MADICVKSYHCFDKMHAIHRSTRTSQPFFIIAFKIFKKYENEIDIQNKHTNARQIVFSDFQMDIKK